MVNVVLKDREQKVIRNYKLADEGNHDLVLLKDTGRLDLVKSAAALKEDGIDFDLIEKVSIKSLHSHAKPIGSHLSLAFVNVEDRTAATPELAEENEDERIFMTYKLSGASHFVGLFLIFMAGFVIQRFFTPAPVEEQQTVVILPAQELPKPEVSKPVETVKMAERIEPKKQVQVRKITQPKPQPKKQMLVQSHQKGVTQGLRKSPQPELGTLKTLAKIGGIGTSLNGNKGTGFGTSRSGAFGNKNGMGGGLGSGTTGGLKSALGGKGLVNGLSGAGSQANGAAGYGSSSFGGGHVGRGGGSVGEKIGNLMVPDFNDGEVNGGLTREQVEAVVRRNSGQLLYCYEKALQASPSLRGRLTLEWIIGPQGTVSTVKMASTSLKAKGVESCVLASLKKWKFPRPLGGVNVDVSYPFDFGRMNLMAKEG